MKNVVFVMVLLAASLVVSNASAAMVELTDATLMSFGDWGGGTLTSVTDIAGNPGVQYNVTWPSGSSTAFLGLSGQALIDSGVLGNTWSIQFDNPDTGGLYGLSAKWARLAYYSSDAGDWFFGGYNIMYNSDPPVTVTLAIPADAPYIAMQVGTWDWAEAWGDRSFQVVGGVVPEPATLILLGLGGLSMIRRKRA